jgi:hypothetical protein
MASRWVSAARSSVDYHYSHRSHLVIETADRREGFVLFGGFRARHRFAALYLGPAAEFRTRLIVHRPATAEECRALCARFGLVVFCTDSAPADLRPELITLPFDVEMELPTPAVFHGPGAPWGRSAKSNISRVKRGRFDFDVVTGDQMVTEFYRRMFRPSMRTRHGFATYIERRGALVELARASGAELLRVFRDGCWVGATLNQSTAAGYELVRVGWLDGDPTLLEAGIVSATYWFSFQRAASLGHSRILLTAAAPFLEDGIFVYKANWGARISSEQHTRSEFHLLLEPSHPVCRRFLRSHSLVATGTNGDLIVFSGKAPSDSGTTPTVLNGLARWYRWSDTPVSVSAVAEEVPRHLQPWVVAEPRPELG